MGCDINRDSLLAWSAGFLDGEGTFLLTLLHKQFQRRPGVLLRRPHVSATQSLSDEPLRRLVETLGGSIVLATRKTTTGRPVWIWNASGGTAIRRIVPQLLPHLTVKANAARLLLEYAETMVLSGPRLSQSVLDKRKAIVGQFYSLPERRQAIRRVV